ncbi:MAG: lipid A deacylase LpxR family protein [Taibaiella sp.]|nr:lipid A deacylase LpxR family protein [Taibaiella sp.]
MKTLKVLAVAAFCSITSFAQVINNLASYTNVNSGNYFRLNYDNDFFSAKDEYYTQGIHLEYVHTRLNKFVVNKALLHPGFTTLKYGIGAEHNGYTPSSISSDSILYGDRPFAAALYFKFFCIAIDAEHQQRLSTALSLGVVGSAAGAQQMQTSIHKWLNNVTPHGWEHQIHNDLILNYEVNYEKKVFSLGNIFLLDAVGMARVGTFSDKAGIGTTAMLGFFESPFGAQTGNRRKWSIYAYDRPEYDVVLYDATLQGGLFNRTSPYTIAAGDISRVTFQNRFGVAASAGNIRVEYFQTYLSKEFATGTFHKWGGVQLAVGF